MKLKTVAIAAAALALAVGMTACGGFFLYRCILHHIALPPSSVAASSEVCFL